MRPRLVLIGLCLTVLGLAAAPVGVRAAGNPAFWKHEVKGDFADVLSRVRNGLLAAQFQITAEENLSRGWRTTSTCSRKANGIRSASRT